MRKYLLIILGIGIIAGGVLFFKRQDTSLFQPTPILYSSELKQPPESAQPFKWDIGQPPKQQFDTQIDLRKQTQKKSVEVGFTLCGNESVARPDTLAEKLSPTKDRSPLLPVDCGIIKTSIPLSF